MMRRYVAVVQDRSGYPAPGECVSEVPPELFEVVKAEEHEAEVGVLRAALEGLRGQFGCFCGASDPLVGPRPLQVTSGATVDLHTGACRAARAALGEGGA